jgi:hypothetical protein
MNKFLVFLLLLILGPILGGIYGIIHDQITYSISDEYYTKFKFVQFGISEWGLGRNIGSETDPEIILDSPRYGAAIVGFLATWWVGLFIGFGLGLIGLIHGSWRAMLSVTMRAILITIITALLTGLIGLVYGKLFLVDSPPDWFYPSNLREKGKFIMVGSMHNFSYLGGLIGLIAAMFYSVRQRKSVKNR